MKSILTLLISLMFINQAAAQIECYSLASGENGQGSRNTIRLQSITKAYRSNSDLIFTIRNIASRNFNVKLRFYDHNGQPFEPSTTYTSANFSSTNTPIADVTGSGAAFLTPESIGVVRVDTVDYSTITPEITWQTDACMPNDALYISVTAEHSFKRNSTYYNTLIPVNNGNAF